MIASVRIPIGTTCWDKTVFTLKDGNSATVAKKTVKQDPEPDDLSFETAHATLKFDGKKVHTGKIQLRVNVDDHETVFRYRRFDMNQHTYQFDMTYTKAPDCFPMAEPEK